MTDDADLGTSRRNEPADDRAPAPPSAVPVGDDVFGASYPATSRQPSSGTAIPVRGPSAPDAPQVPAQGRGLAPTDEPSDSTSEWTFVEPADRFLDVLAQEPQPTPAEALDAGEQPIGREIVGQATEPRPGPSTVADAPQPAGLLGGEAPIGREPATAESRLPSDPAPADDARATDEWHRRAVDQATPADTGPALVPEQPASGTSLDDEQPLNTATPAAGAPAPEAARAFTEPWPPAVAARPTSPAEPGPVPLADEAAQHIDAPARLDDVAPWLAAPPDLESSPHGAVQNPWAAEPLADPNPNGSAAWVPSTGDGAADPHAQAEEPVRAAGTTEAAVPEVPAVQVPRADDGAVEPHAPLRGVGMTEAAVSEVSAVQVQVPRADDGGDERGVLPWQGPATGADGAEWARPDEAAPLIEAGVDGGQGPSTGGAEGAVVGFAGAGRAEVGEAVAHPGAADELGPDGEGEWALRAAWAEARLDAPGTVPFGRYPDEDLDEGREQAGSTGLPGGGVGSAGERGEDAVAGQEGSAGRASLRVPSQDAARWELSEAAPELERVAQHGAAGAGEEGVDQMVGDSEGVRGEDDTASDLMAAGTTTQVLDDADRPARARFGRRRRREGKQVPFWKELPVLIGVALVLALVIKSFVVQAFFIPSQSMENTLKVGDRVLVNKIVYHTRSIQRGDVVVFNGLDSWDPEVSTTSPGNPVTRAVKAVGGFFGLVPGEKDYIKRVIGVGGDHVSCAGNGAPIMVNGHPLSETGYLYPGNAPSVMPFNIVVPKGRVWVMGDHREVSADSRYHLGEPGGGTISTTKVVGRAFVVVWPINRWKTLPIPSTFGQPALAGAALSAAPAALSLIGALPITLLYRRTRGRRRSGRS